MERRPPLIPWILALVLLAVLPVLGWLQFHWLGQLHTAERQRLAAGLETGVERFAKDFDREIGDLFVTFQVADLRIADAYEGWHDRTGFPELLREVYTASSEAGRPLRWSRFTPPEEPHPEVLPPVIAELVAGPRTPGTLTFEPLDAERWILLVPQPPVLSFSDSRSEAPLAEAVLFEHIPPPHVLVLGRPFLATEMLRTLAERHLPSTGEGFELALLRVWAESEEVLAAPDPSTTLERLAPPDAEITLLEGGRPDDALFPDDRRSTFLRSPSSFGLSCVDLTFTRPLVPETVMVEPVVPPTPDDLTVTFMLTRDAASEPSWRLKVRHRAGSLEAALEAARLGNLVIGILILLVLTSSLVLLVVLVMRSQRLARQQMNFVAGVSHEFRTPLAVIGSAAGNLADGLVEGPEQVRTYGDLLRRESHRLTDLVERVLTFAGTGSRRFDVRPVDVNAAVGRVLEDLAHTLEEIGVTVERRIPADLPAASTDCAALETALQNLVSNAVKHGSHEGRWIAIEARTEPGPHGLEIGITVRDRGPGIDPEDRPHVFEPFYRGRRARDDQVPGSGLGLSLVARLMRHLGGRIALETERRRGTALTLYLPAALTSEGAR